MAPPRGALKIVRKGEEQGEQQQKQEQEKEGQQQKQSLQQQHSQRKQAWVTESRMFRGSLRPSLSCFPFSLF